MDESTSKSSNDPIELRTRRWEHFVQSTGLNDSALYLMRCITYVVLISIIVGNLIVTALVTSVTLLTPFVITGITCLFKVWLMRFLPRTVFLNRIGWLGALAFASLFNTQTQLHITYQIFPFYSTILTYIFRLLAAVGIISAGILAYIVFNAVIKSTLKYLQLKKEQPARRE